MRSLQIVKDTIQNNTEELINNGSVKFIEPFNWWVVISVIEFLLIIILIIKLNKKRKKSLLKNEFVELENAKSTDVDMSDLMNNINGSRDLYKSLSRKVHPDRFHDEQSKKKADILFQEISSHKRNYSKLTELKARAERELNINFK